MPKKKARKSGSLTVRFTLPQLRKLRLRAEGEGRTASDYVRDVVERAIDDQPSLFARLEPLIGSLSDRRLPHGADARRALGKWKPDRRG